MRTLIDNRDRERRQLEAGRAAVGEGPYCLVDDVAVSGLTLAVAREALNAKNDSMAVVGMAMQSRRLEKRVGMRVRSAMRYAQDGGGRPAVNTFATFVGRPEIRQQYAAAKFGDPRALDEIVKTYQGVN